MKIDGSWYNPLYRGEGFSINEYPDGTVIAYWYTYDQSAQLWLICVGERQGNTIACTAYRTQGGGLASTENPALVDELEWGEVVFDDSDGLSFTFDSGIHSGGYDLEPLHVVGEPEPPPPDPEDPPNPFEGKLSFRVKGFKVPQFYDGGFVLQGGKWYAIWSTAQIHYNSLGAGRNTMLELEITAHEELNILSRGASGYGNPSWEDVPGFIPAGDTVTVSCELTKASKPTGHANANFQLDTNLGTLVLYTSRILGGTG